jgi:hypothetical protein
MDETIVQEYEDDMILVSDGEENLQKLVNRAISFFDFANIKLNPNKCEVLRFNEGKDDKNIFINGVVKEFIVIRISSSIWVFHWDQEKSARSSLLKPRFKKFWRN